MPRTLLARPFSRPGLSALALASAAGLGLLTASPVLAQPATQPATQPAPQAGGSRAQTLAARGLTIDQLLAELTIEEKAGQMTQLTLEVLSSQKGTPTTQHVLSIDAVRNAIVRDHVGSVLNTFDVAFTPEHWRDVIGQIQTVATTQTRHGIPIIYGVDSVHGANYVVGATIFPHNLNLAATFDPELAAQAGAITAAETRAVGPSWNFSPVCDVARTPLWSRLFETFGEDPLVAGRMAAANIAAMQGSDLSSPLTVAACGKHFVGYSAPDSGRDRTPATISQHEMGEVFLPPFRAAIAAGVRTMMVNSGSVNGVPVHASAPHLTGLLRNELGFRGVAVTDWADIDKLRTFHRVAATEKDAVEMAVNAGIDMAMTPYTTSFATVLTELVREGRITEARLDQSVRRILELKRELGLFEDPMPASDYQIGSEAAAETSLQAARASLTLLRNRESVLPVSSRARVLVTGPAADSLPALHGSWTYTWQGRDEAAYPDTPTIADAFATHFGELASHVPGVDFAGNRTIAQAIEAANKADVIVLCLGELPSTEKPGDIDDLTLDRDQIELAWAMAATGKPVVLVLVTNRPRLITAFESQMSAVIWAGHPGPHGGRALAELIAGDIEPMGRLPFTYPRHPGALFTYDHVHSEVLPAQDGTGDLKPMFEFASGLSYTTVATALAEPVIATVNGQSVLRVNANLTNTGSRKAHHVAALFVSDEYATVIPAVRRLKDFTRTLILPGEAVAVSFDLTKEALSFTGVDGRPVFEPGAFTLRLGDQSRTVNLGLDSAGRLTLVK